jgi:hypothetical protein
MSDDSPTPPSPTEDPRTTRARRILYLAMAIGMLLPFVVILIVNALTD